VPDISFHTGVEDRTLYLCRLLRKAARQGARVLVRGDAGEVDLLDKALWTFEAQDFVPHHRLRAGQVLPAHMERTLLWLVTEGETFITPGEPPLVLLRLGMLESMDIPDVDRVIELVGLDDEERRLARRRWRAYEARGVIVQHHALASS